MSEEFKEEPREEEEKRMKFVECPVCGQKYGHYLHFCPTCGTKNETKDHESYWGKEYENKS